MSAGDRTGWPVPGPLLSGIDGPEQLRALSPEDLPQLCRELREFIWETVQRVGGHLAASLGVVELTVVLHYLFDTPADRILWDVGHQGYVHKVLTGRRDQLRTIRQHGGISGFLKRSESPHDVFGAGHASTAISAALGVATARDRHGESYRVVAVVGDGGMTGGLSFEGLNNAGASGRDLIVILNDNAMSISPNVGAISRYLTSIISSPTFNRIKAEIWDLSEKMPKSETFRLFVRRVEESIKTLVTPGTLFEDLGFRYFGPIDGHDLRALASVLEQVRGMKGPILVHVQTMKGKGYEVAELEPVKYHGVRGIQPASGKVEPRKPRRSYTEVFGEGITRLARRDPRVVAVTAAMVDGTGLVPFAREFPERFFDVGIAEAHATTFCAGMATQGLRPVAAIYSTFLQRAYDQIVHDVALQRLPVIFCLDRAGLVGEDGPTHHGVLDLSYLSCVPGMVVAAPRSGAELLGLLETALAFEEGPFAIRYPRDSVPEEEFPESTGPIPVGSWETLRPLSVCNLLAVGSMVPVALEAADALEREGLRCGVVNCRFVRPLDEGLLERLAHAGARIFTLEENVLSGGFGSRVAQWFETVAPPDRPAVWALGLPDAFVEHGSRSRLLEICGLTAGAVAQRVAAALRCDGPRGQAGERPAATAPEGRERE